MRTWKCWALGLVVSSFLVPAVRAERYRHPSAMILASSVAPSTTFDAFINVAGGPYPGAASITTGNASPWAASAAIVPLFGGTPTQMQKDSFDQTVYQRVEQTFEQSGVPVRLTPNPYEPAAHTISIVSNTSAALLPSAIGMTYQYGSGFSFIDQEARAAQSIDQLEWIVAHNIAHELMVAFGLGENYDQSGNYIDSRNANWAMMTGPAATFSPAASQALQDLGLGGASSQLAQVLIRPAIVPEPSAIFLWGLGALSLAAAGLVRKASGKG